MAYPTGTLGIVLADIDRRILSLKSFCERINTRLETTAPATVIVDLFINLKSEKAALAAAVTVPGIAAYAQIQKGDENLDAVAEFQALTTLIDTAISWISANFPNDANGYLLRETWGNDGPVDRTFAPATTVTLRNGLTAIINAIN